MRVLTASILVMLMLALACASPQPVEKSTYLLRVDPAHAAGAVRSDARVAMANVAVAAYLDAPGLAIEIAPNQLRSARNHVWSEPLDRSLRLFLRSTISQSLGEDVGLKAAGGPNFDQVVSVLVEQLHGTMSGSALLVASYQIAGPGESLAEFRFAESAPLQSEGYSGLVATEKQLLKNLGRAIASSLRETR